MEGETPVATTQGAPAEGERGGRGGRGGDRGGDRGRGFGRGSGGRGGDRNNQTDDENTQNGGNAFKVGSIGYMRDLDDALPLVGSLELGSPDLGNYVEIGRSNDFRIRCEVKESLNLGNLFYKNYKGG